MKQNLSFNKDLLKEELKRYKLLSEYDFFAEDDNKEDDLLLGNLAEVDEDPAEEPAEEPVDDSKSAANAPEDGGENLFDTGEETEEPAEEEPTEEPAEEPTEEPAEEPMDDTSDEDMSFDTEEEPAEEPIEEPATDDVEVDVTDLVKGSDEAKKSAIDASQKTSELLSKFEELERRIAAMDSITNKIDTLEKEIVKRNPTPVEKLEMRSMNSFPYNIKLTDYWKDVDGYDATGAQDTEKKKEYVLTQDDIDTGFSDASIKQSLNVPEDYEEEDI